MSYFFGGLEGVASVSLAMSDESVGNGVVCVSAVLTLSLGSEACR